MDVADQVEVLRVGLLCDPWDEYFKAEVLACELELDGGTDGAESSGSLELDGEKLWVWLEWIGKIGPG
jgi:hypothetical protein